MEWEDSEKAPWYKYEKKRLKNRYTYNGKEIEEEVIKQIGDVKIKMGHLAYGARMYDPSLGRFTGVDPIADQFADLSTYNYADNEPVRNIDLHGLQAYDAIENGVANGSPGGEPLGDESNVKKGFNYLSEKVNADKAALSSGYAAVRSFLSGAIAGQAEGALEGAGFEGGRTFRSNGSPEGEFAASVANSSQAFLESAPEIAGEIGVSTFEVSIAMAPFNGNLRTPAGKIYRVPGSATNSGLPYIGRTKQTLKMRNSGARDGRDRSKASVVDYYEPANGSEGPYKEQRAIINNGGVSNLDNRRNEVSTRRMEQMRKKYGG